MRRAEGESRPPRWEKLLPKKPVVRERRLDDDRWLEEGQPVVQRLALRYAGNGLAIEDLMAAGRLGLVEAAMRYDASRGASFATYATWWVRKQMLDALLAQSRSIAVSRYRMEQQRRLTEVRREMDRHGGDDPDVRRMADRARLSERVARRAMVEQARIVSLDESATEDGESGADRLADRDAVDPQDAVVRQDGVRRVLRLMRDLPERERKILAWRFGLGGEDPMSSQRVGDRVGLSRERIRQIEAKCLRWLRRRLRLEAGPE